MKGEKCGAGWNGGAEASDSVTMAGKGQTEKAEPADGDPPPGDSWVAQRTPGALVRVDLDTAHYLTMGYGSRASVLVNSDLVFTPSCSGTNIARYTDPDRLRIGGLVWPTAAKKLAGTPYLVEEPVGAGKLILFADDPNFRLLLRGLRRLFLNAVLFSPYLEAEVRAH